MVGSSVFLLSPPLDAEVLGDVDGVPADIILADAGSDTRRRPIVSQHVVPMALAFKPQSNRGINDVVIVEDLDDVDDPGCGVRYAVFCDIPLMDPDEGEVFAD